MINGSITLNGLDDHHLILILQEKEKNSHFTFNPQSMQSGLKQVSPGRNAQIYNNVILGWSDETALKGVQNILHKIHPHQPE